MEISGLYRVFLSCGTVTTDSRTIQGGELFFALKGENFDGNDYALKALEEGAEYAVVDRPELSGEGVIHVPDSLAALQGLARYHREHVRGGKLPVIGLTGTNGKTTTKELITSVLSHKFHVTATQGNLNNDIGVPLTLLRVNEETEVAVVEMGASHPDDIKRLVEIVRPDYGLITNVGMGHILGFGSFEGVKRAKGRLYDFLAGQGGTVFVNADDEVLEEMLAGRQGFGEIIRYGLGESGVGVTECGTGTVEGGVKVLETDGQHPYLRLRLPSGIVETRLIGAYNASNVLAALAVGQHFGVSEKDAMAAIEDYTPNNSRSQLIVTEYNTLILDAYNANPVSMKAAIDNLSVLRTPRKAVMLGDMLELGSMSAKAHKEIVQLLMEQDFDKIYLVGYEFGAATMLLRAEEETAEPFPAGKVAVEGRLSCFETSAALYEHLQSQPIEGYTVLIKGSRGMRMEKMLQVL